MASYARLVNPRRKRSGARRTRAIRRSPAQRVATRKMLAANRAARSQNHRPRRANRSKTRARRRTHSQTQPNPGLLTILSNPKSKRGGVRSMAKRRRTRRTSAQRAAFRKMISARSNPGRRRRRNPHRSARSARRRSNTRYSRRRNPSVLGFQPMDLLKLGVGSVAGSYGSRAIPQAIAGAYNTGWTGYLLNILATLGLGWGTQRFVGRDAAIGVIAGGLGATAMRIWDEQVSGMLPTAAAATGTSGMGDASFSSTGLGWYSPYDFTQGRGGPYLVQGPSAAIPAQKGVTQAAAAGVVQMPRRGRAR